MPYTERDDNSGALLFKKTADEKSIAILERKVQVLEEKYEHLERLISKLSKK
jgi:hypothetical protein